MRSEILLLAVPSPMIVIRRIFIPKTSSRILFTSYSRLSPRNISEAAISCPAVVLMDICAVMNDSFDCCAVRNDKLRKIFTFTFYAPSSLVRTKPGQYEEE